MYHWTVIWSCIDCRLKNKVMHERTGVCEIPVPISSQNQKWGGTHTNTHTPWAVIHNQMIIFLSSLPVLMVCKNKSSLHSCSSGRVNQAANFDFLLKQKRPNYYCNFCKIQGHSTERCLKKNPKTSSK